MDVMEWLAMMWRNHRGKMIGIALGLIFALCVIEYGFFQALFICLCVIVGLYIGVKVDQKVDIRQSVEDIFKN